jgi:hypothetical protein
MDKNTACVVNAEIVEREQSLVRPSEIAGEGGVLATVTKCRALVALATGAPQLAALRDYLSTVEKALRLRGEARALQNEVAETKLRAERRLGQLIKESGVRPGNPQLSRDATIGRLPDGVTRIQAMRWRRESEVPEEVFEKWVAEIKASGDDDLTSAGLLRLRDQFTGWVKEVKKKEPAKLERQEREDLGSEFAKESAAPPTEFRAIDELETDYCCPRCRFEWSGDPKPAADQEEEVAA